MNKKILVILVAAIVLLAIILSSAWAFMFKRTEEFVNDFDPAQVSCTVEEVFENNTKSSVKVKNTSNIPAYIRVRLVSYWQDTKGNIVQRASVMPQFKIDSENWLDMGDNTYCYIVPVASNGLTENLLKDSTITLDKTSEVHNEVTYEYHQVVEIIAEAIQSKPADAVSDSWGVIVNDAGEITGLKQNN